jgi:ATP-dependent DNA helicase DinG
MPAAVPTETRLATAAAATMRAAIRMAGGREVCFVCTVDADGLVLAARAVARGDAVSVLALPGVTERGEMLVHNHPSGNLEPSPADLSVAARLHDGGVGFGIIDNQATELYVVVEIPRQRERRALDTESIHQDLGPDGPIALLHQRYEDRPSQRDMAARIAQLYNDGGVGLLEAGTGVGKSMAYLVPALRWAAANGERTVVSTNTINLQEQLVGKDLPFLERALSDQKVRYALLKGWRNYVCLQRLEQARSSGSSLFDDGMQEELGAITAWVERTSDGSLGDLPVQPRAELWDEVSAEPDLCGRTQCAHFDQCFLFRARRQAAQADVVVVNHHLLLADLAVRRASGNWSEAAVLPSYTRLVLDEGHHLEDAAAAHLGVSVSRRALQRLFGRLDRRGRGLLPALSDRLSRRDDLLSAASLEIVRSRLQPAVVRGRDKVTLLFDLLAQHLSTRGDAVLRLQDDFGHDPIWSGGLRSALEDSIGEVSVLQDGLRMVRERLESSASEGDESTPSLLNEMRSVARRLASAGDALRETLDPSPGEPMVRWMEARGRDRAIVVSAVPLELAPVLRDDLFGRVRTAVITSATLATDPSFAFVTRRLGLDDDTLAPHTEIYPSPFDYAAQSLLVVPTDIPAPNTDKGGHAAAALRCVMDLAEAADGGMFVLFTSHGDVRAAAAEFRARGLDRRWPLLVHGEDPRDALLGRFRDAGRAILLGTASFWEGVDVPGSALRALVMAKLPFRVPTEPVTAAQCEAIEARGGEPFTEYMLPHASLRLKQGFGRLIRTSTDRGVVVITDPRLVTKGYGRGLLTALPPAERVVAPWASALDRIRQFYLTTS